MEISKECNNDHDIAAPKTHGSKRLWPKIHQACTKEHENMVDEMLEHLRNEVSSRG